MIKTIDIVIIKFRILFFICILLPDALLAQQSNGSHDTDFPYQLSSLTDIYLIGSGTALLYTGGLLQGSLKPMGVTELSLLNASDVWFVDRFATNNWNPELNTIRETFEPASIVSAAGMLAFVGLQKRIRDYTWTPMKTLALMYLEGAYLTEGTVLLTKAITKRPRPYAYNPSLPIEQKARSANNESFFSGNAGLLFYHASFISLVLNDIYPGQKWVPYVFAGTHGLALLSGYWSIKSGMHFPTDILVGALWGSGMAYLVTRLHKSKTRRISVSPWTAFNPAGDIYCGVTIRFKALSSYNPSL